MSADPKLHNLALDPSVKAGDDGRTLEAVTEDMRAHLHRRVELHGQADTVLMIDGMLAGIARFIADRHGLEVVRVVFGGMAYSADNLAVLHGATLGSETVR